MLRWVRRGHLVARRRATAHTRARGPPHVPGPRRRLPPELRGPCRDRARDRGAALGAADVVDPLRGLLDLPQRGLVRELLGGRGHVAVGGGGLATAEVGGEHPQARNELTLRTDERFRNDDDVISFAESSRLCCAVPTRSASSFGVSA